MNMTPPTPYYLRPANERGHANFGWLDTRHSFSFGNYYDPRHLGFGLLRVINDDDIAPGAGFGEHGHRDMEIVTVVLEGGLSHADSMGNGSTIRPDDVQRMSAGSGIRHSEFNASRTAPVKLLQIWLLPEHEDIEPGYEEKSIDLGSDNLTLLASPDARSGSVKINTQADLYRCQLSQPQHFELAANRCAYVHLIDGELEINGMTLSKGDGLGVRPTDNIQRLKLTSSTDADFLLFDMAT